MEIYYDATDLGDDTGRSYATVTDEGYLSVVYNEGQRWHREVRNVKENLTDADLEEMAETVMAEMGNAHRVSAWLTADMSDPEEDAIEFSIEIPLPLPADELTEELAAELAWSFIATCINVTDPGTFGAPYIFGPYTKED